MEETAREVPVEKSCQMNKLQHVQSVYIKENTDFGLTYLQLPSYLSIS